MGQLRIFGEKRVEFLESVVVLDIAKLEVNQMGLTCMTNDQGGIIDDCQSARLAGRHRRGRTAGVRSRRRYMTGSWWSVH